MPRLPDGLRVGFERRYGAPPGHAARAPGRVNLIGEHIDYCGLPVLPMALDRSVRLAFRPRADRRIRLATMLPAHDPCEIPLRAPIARGPEGDWANYPRAAIQALLASDDFAPAGGAWRGFDGLVSADLPAAAGLSSSSALVVATALALLASNGSSAIRGRPSQAPTGRLALAELLARGERYVGTEGGGMDQAVCLLGRAGCALRLDFEPLRATPIPLPPGWAVLVAQSGERAEKSGAARAVYNEREAEARRALAAARQAVGAGDRAGYRELIAASGPEALLEAAGRTLDDPLRRRFRHIVSEAERVERMERALGAADLETAGALLLASHESLRDDYEVSTSRLDALVDAAMSAGAAGARLTGAGLGGSIVALCEASRAGEVLEGLGRTADLAVSPFVAVPGEGAGVGVL